VIASALPAASQGNQQLRDFVAEILGVVQPAAGPHRPCCLAAISQYQGKIIKAFYNVGDDVKPGDILFTIDSPDLLQAESTLLAAASVRELQKKTLTRVTRLLKSGGAAQKNAEGGSACRAGLESEPRHCREAAEGGANQSAHSAPRAADLPHRGDHAATRRSQSAVGYGRALFMALGRPRQTSLWRECVLGAAPVAPKISLPRAVGHQTTNAHKSENGSTMMPR